MTNTSPIYIDATMLYRWRHLAPVGIVRLERMLTAHLRFQVHSAPVEYVMWDHGYRPTTTSETALLDDLLRGESTAPATTDPVAASTHLPRSTRRAGLLPTVRRAGLRTIARVPDHLRPFAEQAAWSLATFGVESTRYMRRSRQRRVAVTSSVVDPRVRHVVDFGGGGDLVALGLGWEYLDHESMYLLKQQHGIRIHMPAFDLIPVLMPQMNAGQSHLVHRYYAEMAHYADSITCISHATESAIRQFYADESLPVPQLTTNQLPGFAPANRNLDPSKRRHRFEGQPFVLSVSTVEVRKNHLLLAKIWAECIAQGVELPRLVIVGRVGWDVNELMQWVFNAPELIDSCTIASDVDDDELVHLYEDSLFTVFPSRIEGWGLPITESLTHGKVCVHSTDPAQLEASQGLMPALHPDDFLGWKSEIVRLVADADHRSALEARIATEYRPTTTEEYCQRFEHMLFARRDSPR